MFIKVFVALILSSCSMIALALDFSQSQWIWPDNGGLPPANIPANSSGAFLLPVCPPGGETIILWNAIITAETSFNFWVDNVLIGTGDDWQTPQFFCGPLNNPSSGCINFAVSVNVGSTPSPAGLLAAITIFYDDGSSRTIGTGPSWFGRTPAPPGFQADTNTLFWLSAIPVANFGSSPWGIVATPAITITTAKQCAFATFNKAEWIWTNEIDPLGNAPAGSRAFRKTLELPTGVSATSVVIIIDADNEFELFVQGLPIGSGNNWAQGGQIFRFYLLPPTSYILIAVSATNAAFGPAGLIASVLMTTSSGEVISMGTDSTWLYNTLVPDGFELLEYDDYGWPKAIVEASDGGGPWGALPIPTGV